MRKKPAFDADEKSRKAKARKDDATALAMRERIRHLDREPAMAELEAQPLSLSEIVSAFFANDRVTKTPGGLVRNPESCRSRLRALMEETGVSTMKEFHLLLRGDNMEAESLWWKFHDNPKSPHFGSSLIRRTLYDLKKEAQRKRP